MPGRSTRTTSNVINKAYGATGRGRKEVFRGRKATLCRKNEEISRTGAYSLCLIYQPHRGRFHLHRSSNSPDNIWPFSIEDFMRNNEVEVVSIDNNDSHMGSPEIPPLPVLEPGSPMSPVKSQAEAGYLVGRSSRAAANVQVRIPRYVHYNRYELNISPIRARHGSNDAREAQSAEEQAPDPGGEGEVAEEEEEEEEEDEEEEVEEAEKDKGKAAVRR